MVEKQHVYVPRIYVWDPRWFDEWKDLQFQFSSLILSRMADCVPKNAHKELLTIASILKYSFHPSICYRLIIDEIRR